MNIRPNISVMAIFIPRFGIPTESRLSVLQMKYLQRNIRVNVKNDNQGGLAATFDLAAFGLYMIAPVKKSVNHSKTLTSMREVQRSLARTTREYVCFCSW